MAVKIKLIVVVVNVVVIVISKWHGHIRNFLKVLLTLVVD